MNETADKLWARFAESCDADGLTDFSGLQALIVRSRSAPTAAPAFVSGRISRPAVSSARRE